MKKKIILEEVKEWVEDAKNDHEDSSYNSYQNDKFETEFRVKGTYHKKMEELYKELEELLNAIKDPFIDTIEEEELDIIDLDKSPLPPPTLGLVRTYSIRSEKVQWNEDDAGENIDKIDMDYDEY